VYGYASELEVYSSKRLMSYGWRLKRDLQGTQRCGGLVGVRERNMVYYCGVLATCSTFMPSCPMAMANLIVARTASIFDVYVSRSDGEFPPM
jgi:hypothetical protein